MLRERPSPNIVALSGIVGLKGSLRFSVGRCFWVKEISAINHRLGKRFHTGSVITIRFSQVVKGQAIHTMTCSPSTRTAAHQAGDFELQSCPARWVASLSYHDRKNMGVKALFFAVHEFALYNPESRVLLN